MPFIVSANYILGKARSKQIYFEIEPQNRSPQIEVRFWKTNFEVKPFQANLKKPDSVNQTPLKSNPNLFCSYQIK